MVPFFVTILLMALRFTGAVSFVPDTGNVEKSRNERRLAPNNMHCPQTNYKLEPPCINYDTDICSENAVVECDQHGCPARFSSYKVILPPPQSNIAIDPWDFCRRQGLQGLMYFGRRHDPDPCSDGITDRYAADCGYDKDTPGKCENYPYCCTIDSIDIQCHSEKLKRGNPCFIGPLPDFVIPATCEEGTPINVNEKCQFQCMQPYQGYAEYECQEQLDGFSKLVETKMCQEQSNECSPYYLPGTYTPASDPNTGQTACLVDSNGYVTLTAGSECSYTCSQGGYGEYGFLECPHDASPGQAVNIPQDLTCVYAKCAPYTQPSSWDLAELNCVNMTLEATEGNHCPLHCKEGYSGKMGAVVCPLDAQNGDTPVAVVTNFSTTMETMKVTSGIPSSQLSMAQCRAFSFVIGMAFVQIDNSMYPVCGIDETEARVVYNTNSNAVNIECTVSVPCPLLTSSFGCTDNICNALTLPNNVVGETNSRVNVNTADAQTLETLPNIGPTRASAIIEYRNTNGPFRILDDLMEVYGIGSTNILYIRPYATVNDKSCQNGTILSHHSNSACDIRCADGWYGEPSSFECSNYNPTGHHNYDAVTTMLECVEAKCSEFDFSGGTMQGGGTGVPCSHTTRLGTQTNTECTVECVVGYSSQGSGIVSCPANALEYQSPNVDLICTEISCSALDLSGAPIGAVPGDSGNPCSMISPYTVLSTITNPTCTVRCDAGYTGAEIMAMCGLNSSPDDPPQHGQINCTENSCQAFYYTNSSSQSQGSESDPCTNGMILNTRTEPTSCSFVQNGVRMRARCLSNALMGDPLTIYDDSLSESTCSRYEFETGVVEGDVDGCFNNIQLTTISDNSCTLRCAEGWSGTGGSVMCPSNASSGQSPVSSVNCTQNRCAPLEITSLGLESSLPSCSEGAQMLTGSTCVFSCMSGYSGNGGGTAYCSGAAFDGDDASIVNSCVENECLPWQMPDFVIPSGSQPCSNNIVLSTRSNPECQVSCAPGYEGNDMIVQCQSDSNTGDESTVNNTCLEILCAPFYFPNNTKGFGDSTTGVLPCSDGIILMPISTPICHLTCADGFYDPNVTHSEVPVECSPNANAGDPALPVMPLECEPVLCSLSSVNWDVVSEFTCTSSTELRAGESCEVKCPVGYVDRTIAVNCPITATPNQAADVEPFVCSKVQCTQFLFGIGMVGDNTTTLPACENKVQLSTNSTCAIKCDTGYAAQSGNISCPLGSNFGASAISSFSACNEIRCDAVNISTIPKARGLELDIGCTDGDRLNTLSAPTECYLGCSEGYFGPGGKAYCSSNSTEGSTPKFSLDCYPGYCEYLYASDGIYFPDVDVLGTLMPCREGMEMSAINGSSCAATCAPGFEGDVSKIECHPTISGTGGQYLADGSCQETKCARFIFQPDMEEILHNSNSCQRGVALYSQSTSNCLFQCAPGYLPDIGELSCPSNATSGEQAKRNMTCVPLPNLNISLRCNTTGCTSTNKTGSIVGGLVCEQNNIVTTGIFPSTEGGDYVVIENMNINQEIDYIMTNMLGNMGLPFVRYYLDLDDLYSSDLTWVSETSFAMKRMCEYDESRHVMECPIPSGLGVSKSIKLKRYLRDEDGLGFAVGTGILTNCDMTFARPSILSITGCRDDKCSRSGDDRITVHGKNFGFMGSLIFIDGQECRDVKHVDSANTSCVVSSYMQQDISCHQRVSCMTPKLWSSSLSTSIMVIQSNQFSPPVNNEESGFSYASCTAGTEPEDDSPDNCVPCDIGKFADASMMNCETCIPGKIATSPGSSQCQDCNSNEIPSSDGASCLICEGGTSSSIGDDVCENCPFMYSFPFFPIGHCEQPLMAYVLGFVLVIVALICMYRWRKSQKKKAKEMQSLKDTLKARHDDIDLLSGAWLIQWDELNLIDRLAAGGNGEVWRGSLRNRYDVAIKLMFDSSDIDLEDDKEIKFLKRARHPRLVLFLGCGQRAENNTIFLVLEFCDKGTLEDYLHPSKALSEENSSPSWENKLQLLADTAEGMAHLHIMLKTLHRDLKSPNVLLGEEKDVLRAKVADFGTARFGQVSEGEVVKEKVSRSSSRRSSKGSERLKSQSRSNSVVEFFTGKGKSSSNLVHDDGPYEGPKTTNVLSSLQGDQSTLDISLDTTSNRSILVDSISSVRSDVSNSGRLRRPSTGMSTMTSGMGSLLWMAPELVKQMKKSRAYYSSSVDVFSFGMICYEALQEALPWSLNKNCAKYSYLIMDKVEAGERPVLDPQLVNSAPIGFVDLMKRCWSQDPDERPPFDEILHTLQDIRGIWHQERIKLKKRSSGLTTTTIHSTTKTDDESVDAAVIELSQVVPAPASLKFHKEEKEEEDEEENNVGDTTHSENEIFAI